MYKCSQDREKGERRGREGDRTPQGGRSGIKMSERVKEKGTVPKWGQAMNNWSIRWQEWREALYYMMGAMPKFLQEVSRSADKF